MGRSCRFTSCGSPGWAGVPGPPGGTAPDVLWVGPHSLDWNTIGANVTQIGIGDLVAEVPRGAGRAQRGERRRGREAVGSAAQLEGSKGFTKTLCDEMDIPTAAYARFDNAAAALAYLDAYTKMVTQLGGLPEDPSAAAPLAE